MITTRPVVPPVDPLGQVLQQLNQIPVLGSELIQGVTVSSAGLVNLNHRLGRAWVGCIIVAQTGTDTTTLQSAHPSETPDPSKQFTLRSTGVGGVTANVLVF